MTENLGTAAPLHSLTKVLAEKGVFSVEDGLPIFRQLVDAVCALHARGRIHRSIDTETAALDQSGRVLLSEPDPIRELGGPGRCLESCPPELQHSDSVSVPVAMEAARQVLSRAGIALDPRRIDVYQLGTLLCRMFTGKPVDAYLQSPLTKGMLPPSVQLLVENALGYQEAPRFSNCEEYAAALEEAIEGKLPTGLETPRPAGNTIVSGVFSASKEGAPIPSSLPSASGDGVEENLPFVRLGHYRVVRRIGHGGMGDVYLGFEDALQRPVALKVLPAELARNEDFVRRFHAEAAAVAKLSHPHIVPIHAIGKEGEHHFFAMQYVEGESLDRLLARRGRLDVEETLIILEQCLAGLGAAHQAKLVHRDIKPGNILIEGQSRRVLVADFGLVKSAGNRNGMTATGTVLGTVDYIAPEQARGLEVDARADLYALGVLAYQMLSGHLPFQADTPTAMLFKHAYEAPPTLADVAPGVPALLAAVVSRLMAKEPAQRYPSCEQVLVDLRRCRSTATISGETGAEQSSAADRPSAIILAPSFDRLPELPADLDSEPSSGWRQRLRERMLGLFQAHAPQFVQNLQNTGQQVDGAVAEYQRRRDRLAALVDEAKAVCVDLAAQARSNGEAAALAGRRAEALHEEDEIRQALSARESCLRSAEDLEEQSAEQEEQLAIIQSELAKVEATLVRLKSQRDVLNARLRVAEARLQDAGGKPVSRRRWVYVAAAGVFVIVGMALFLWSRSDRSDQVVEPVLPAPITAVRPKEELPREGSVVSESQDSVAKNRINPKGLVVKPAVKQPLKDVDKAWIQSVTALPPEQQLDEVAKKLKEYNPGFDGTIHPNSKKEAIVSVYLNSDSVFNLSPLKGFPSLQYVSCQSVKLTDLSPLMGMNLTSVSMYRTSIADLGPLSESALLANVRCEDCPLNDLSPLKNLRLAALFVNHTKVSDLSPLKDMPLQELSCGFTPVADLSPLKNLKLISLVCCSTLVEDLSPLRGMPMDRLDCSHTRVSDLSPLRNMALGNLKCDFTQVADLSPLKGMVRLGGISILETKVTDLSPLKGIPTLTGVTCNFERARDEKILRSMTTLQWINHKHPADFWRELDGDANPADSRKESGSKKPAKKK